ncbi:MAG: Phosphoribosylaminoimidazole-succinocarboxamide synthase [Thermodesulfobacterium sp. 37_54]|uniref:Phosphoribosylaminoimidazole-succinocarboxamide synthase n=1 Tax=Thermodesulfobacterium commune TaxID=1741 RepID=A0A101FIE5_9BACT|nr:MAG: Phosphoribosylaminoimidazole-succinocarboxamide synthase [Thermodesulfobacterium sp. 37_54]KUK37609.1 MAG: Phosphoribosylaminoimidazole-succinocarboxamide synthase [Thermodesulfobacterium commune]MDK2861192.1 phosphoribosylaminoimidazole-succinocarboxamide synthase [Thermodesulfobacterium sp.]HAA84245.1 phosphoribosylaminoimidazolesuccinocarboxamide synthase [Thermodesulfobacterium commune]HCP09098.1 phosphoribosylaminoimidazolesuccinocarboxamide synthase [Thermodesulfobacterium commune
MSLPVWETNLEKVPLLKRGKVRDIYDLGDKLLIVATDRISAFDVVLPTPIPYKGKILTQMSLFWFDFLKDIVDNHLITANLEEYPEVLKEYKETLAQRSMLVKKAKVLPVECIVRGYITGSAMKEYQETGQVCGIPLPPGLKEADKLPEPIFTPSTKAEIGEHDVNISYQEMEKLVGSEVAQFLKETSLKIYKKASEYAESRGIIIADTKFEFGIYEDKIILVDEVLTPDSSRFWPKDEYQPGKPQKSFDKQFIRDWLKSISWDPQNPPTIPEDIVLKTREKYLEALYRLTGKTL